MMLIDCSCFWKCVECCGVRCWALRAVDVMYGHDRVEGKTGRMSDKRCEGADFRRYEGS
jgi:hypothetical protein